MAQNLKDDLLKNKPYVDIILSPDSYRKIPDLINRHVTDNKSMLIQNFQDMKYMKICFHLEEILLMLAFNYERCDKFCSFCIVPFTRGKA